jgi:hypothetical protein
MLKLSLIMPQKTKEQKIRAQIHKNLSKKESLEYKVSEQEKQEARVVKKDLTKTALITLVILCIEFLTFYATLRGVAL